MRRLPEPVSSVARRLQAEEPLVPERVVNKTDVLGHKVELPAPPFRLPCEVRFFQAATATRRSALRMEDGMEAPATRLCDREHPFCSRPALEQAVLQPAVGARRRKLVLAGDAFTRHFWGIFDLNNVRRTWNRPYRGVREPTL